jgi:hypothetical protein
VPSLIALFIFIHAIEGHHPFLRQAEDPSRRACLYVEQPIARICVHVSLRPQVFRHAALDWPSRLSSVPTS